MDPVYSIVNTQLHHVTNQIPQKTLRVTSWNEHPKQENHRVFAVDWPRRMGKTTMSFELHKKLPGSTYINTQNQDSQAVATNLLQQQDEIMDDLIVDSMCIDLSIMQPLIQRTLDSNKNVYMFFTDSGEPYNYLSGVTAPVEIHRVVYV